MTMYLGGQKVRITDKSKTNLLDVFNRTEGKLTSGSSNASVRSDIEFDKYYVGFLCNNYYYPHLVKESKVDSFMKTIFVSSLSSGYGIGFPVKCEPNKTYTFSVEAVGISEKGHLRAGFYQEDGTYISFVLNNAKESNYLTFTTPENCSITNLQIGLGKDQEALLTNICLVEGSFSGTTFTDYEPYNFKLTPPIIKITSKNMFNPNGEYYEDRYVSSLSSHKIEEKNTYRTYKIRVKPNTNYVISFLTKNNLYYGFSNSIEIGSNIEGYSINNGSKVINSGNNVYLCFSIWKASVDNLINYIQIEEGDVATEYEPYTSEIHYEY